MIDYKKVIKDIINYANEENVPIMEKEGILYLTNYIDKNKDIVNILEIGTAIGFSAIMMASVRDNINVTTIERDEKRYLEAIRNIKKLDLEKRITLIFNDALNINLDDKYDLIFIDAAKAQNIKFFEKYSKNLGDKGTIITDNMNFHGLVEKDEEDIKSKNLRQLVRKVSDYHDYLKNNKYFDTDFVNVGDGIAISKRKEIDN